MAAGEFSVPVTLETRGHYAHAHTHTRKHANTQRCTSPTYSHFSSLSFAAYNFGFDVATAHADLRVQGDTVTWEPQGVKGHDPRLRAKDNKNRCDETETRKSLFLFLN